jgi:hypothetical protein
MFPCTGQLWVWSYAHMLMCATLSALSFQSNSHQSISTHEGRYQLGTLARANDSLIYLEFTYMYLVAARRTFERSISQIKCFPATDGQTTDLFNVRTSPVFFNPQRNLLKSLLLSHRPLLSNISKGKRNPSRALVASNTTGPELHHCQSWTETDDARSQRC